jgi:hypothetical protein
MAFRASRGLIEESRLPAGLFHVKQNTNGMEVGLVDRFGKTEGL